MDWLSGMEEAPPIAWAATIAAVAVIWFVPTIIAVFRNRAHLRPIAALNVPGGLSWIVWTALIVWAASGKGPPANLTTDARQRWLWAGAGALILVLAVCWFLFTRSP
jgi:hypothetical protein